MSISYYIISTLCRKIKTSHWLCWIFTLVSCLMMAAFNRLLHNKHIPYHIYKDVCKTPHAVTIISASVILQQRNGSEALSPATPPPESHGFYCMWIKTGFTFVVPQCETKKPMHSKISNLKVQTKNRAQPLMCYRNNIILSTIFSVLAKVI